MRPTWIWTNQIRRCGRGRDQDLYAFVVDRLTQRPEVADVRTSVVYEHLRNQQITPARTGLGHQ